MDSVGKPPEIETNLYGYTSNDPVNFIDINGESRIGVVVINFLNRYGPVVEKFATRTYKKAKGFVKNIDVDGPKGTRICQLRFKKLPVARLDFGPFKGTNGDPRLHLHLPKIFPGKHIPLDPRSFFD